MVYNKVSFEGVVKYNFSGQVAPAEFLVLRLDIYSFAPISRFLPIKVLAKHKRRVVATTDEVNDVQIVIGSAKICPQCKHLARASTHQNRSASFNCCFDSRIETPCVALRIFRTPQFRQVILVIRNILPNREIIIPYRAADKSSSTINNIRQCGERAAGCTVKQCRKILVRHSKAFRLCEFILAKCSMVQLRTGLFTQPAFYTFRPVNHRIKESF